MNVLPKIGDAYRLGPSNLIDDGAGGPVRIAYQPAKKGAASTDVPASRDFLAELERHEIGTTFTQKADGSPMASVEVLRNVMQDWTAQAKLPRGRTRHGVRKHGAKALAAAGPTRYEIMCLMPQTQAKTFEVYSKDVERGALSGHAASQMSPLPQ